MSEIKEIPADLKNDIKNAFDLYKNENNKINKLKLRTMLFSFVMYKRSASDINSYIDSKLSNENELYSFDDVCDLILDQLEDAKENDADELFDYIVNNKNDDSKITKKQISKAFESSNIDIDEKEIDKMIEFIKNKNSNNEGESEESEEEPKIEKKKSNVKENNYISRDEFRDFYVEQK